MIPSRKSFDVINVSNGVPAKVIALKLPDDITKAINQMSESDLRIQFNPLNPFENVQFTSYIRLHLFLEIVFG
jgi:hypothetical protein